jgi:hypothetical protein
MIDRQEARSDVARIDPAAALYHFINKKIKHLNVGNFAVVGDTFYVA